MPPLSHEQAVRAGKKTAEIRWGKHRRKAKPVLGFFKDKNGKTRPITKSAVELNRRKLIRKPREFQAVQAANQKKDPAQNLEDLMGQLAKAQGDLESLNQKRTQETHALSLAKIDAAKLSKQSEINAILLRIKRLRA